MEHQLKTWPHFFEMVRIGRKRFEVRKNDRDFKVGDLLVLKEYDPETGEYTGRQLNRGVGDVIDLSPLYDAVVLPFVWHGDSVETTLRNTIATLETELAAARRDTERLDWIEKQRHGDPFITGDLQTGFRVWRYNSNDTVTGSKDRYKTYRAAIDAARQEATHGEK